MSDPNWRLIDQRLGFIDDHLNRFDRRLDDMLKMLLNEHGERIAKLEQRLMADKEQS
jgi:hypothetical protein